MQFDPNDIGQQESYKLLIGCIVPRPIAWVSTVDSAGVANLAPFSFFNAVASNPPALVFACSYAPNADRRKDTLRNIEATNEFVVNIVSEELAEAMNVTAANVPPDIDEFAAASLTPAPSVLVKPPRVAESPVSMECRVLTIVPVGEGPGSASLVIGTVVMIHAREGVVDARHRVDLNQLRPIGRLAGDQYAYVHETFAMPRPRYNDKTGEIEWPS